MSKKNNPLVELIQAIIISIVVVLAMIFGAIFGLDLLTHHGRELTVPDLSNLTVEEAAVVADENDMRIEVTDSVYVKRMKKGAVYRQSPAPGSKVKKGKRLALTINAKNAKMVTMPDLVGLSTRQAKAELLSRGLVLGKLIYVQDMATNNVLKQMLGDFEVAPLEQLESESVINLVVGLNGHDCSTYVPDVKGLKNISAVATIHDNSLNVAQLRFDDTVKDYDDSLNARVYNQLPAPSDSVSVNMGAEVTLYLTLDERKIPVKGKVE